MLTDVYQNLFERPSFGDVGLGLILGVISQGKTAFRKHAPGIYEIAHWSADQNLRAGQALVDHWPTSSTGLDLVDPYGVCDSPEQAMEYLRPLTEEPDRHFVLTLVKIEKSAESPQGGWRWRKWGIYIGTQEPQCEYLYDEPVIECVYTFHLSEVRPQMKGQYES